MMMFCQCLSEQIHNITNFLPSVTGLHCHWWRKVLSTMFYGYFCNLEMGERQLCGKVSLHCSFCFIDRLAKNVIFCKVVLLELLVIIPNSTKLSLILTCEILPCIGLWIANCELSRFLYTFHSQKLKYFRHTTYEDCF